MSAQYMLVSENTHYVVTPSPEDRPDWVYVIITFGKFDQTALKFSDIKITKEELEFCLDLLVSPVEGLTEKDDELQLIASSIMQDIIRNTTIEGSAVLYDWDTGEKIER